MKKIKSRISGKVLHIIQRKSKIFSGRLDLVEPEEFLQVSIHKLNCKKFNSHKHIQKTVSQSKTITQESWVVISGSVRFFAYDEDDSFLEDYILYPGDCSITLYGGHNYEILKPNTIIYEFKTGPYEGIEKDKVNLK